MRTIYVDERGRPVRPPKKQEGSSSAGAGTVASRLVGTALGVFLASQLAAPGHQLPHVGGAAGRVPATVAGMLPAAVAPAPGEAAFMRAVVADLGFRPTPADVSSLEAWSRHEFPAAWPPPASFNPLASTHFVAGSSAFNSFTSGGGMILHVWSYPSAKAGAAATAATLANGHYPLLLAALRSGRGLCGGGLASDFHTWNGGTYAAVC